MCTWHTCVEGMEGFVQSIAIAFAFNKTQAAKVVMRSPALKPGKQGPLVTLFLTSTLAMMALLETRASSPIPG